MTLPTYRLQAVPVEVVRPLRHAVLRAGRPAVESVYPQDDRPDTLHLAAVAEDGRVLACGTFFPEPYQGEPAWRLRGMASAPEVRGRGCAAALLVEALQRLRAQGVERLWCQARTVALPFYRRFGFTVVGEEFLAAHGVPHYVAVLDLAAPPAEGNGTST